MEFRECLLLPSIAGRSSIHSGPLEPVEHLQTLRVLRTWGVGLHFSSSEKS